MTSKGKLVSDLLIVTNHISRTMDKTDWRGGDYKMTDLISRLHSRPDRDAFSDVTFSLPDGSQLKAHKFVLAMASPVFEAQFFGPLADSVSNNPVTIKDVDSTVFRRLIDCIYKSSTDFLQTALCYVIRYFLHEI